MSTSLYLSEILLKHEAGRRASKKPSFCLRITSKAHTGDADLTSGKAGFFHFNQSFPLVREYKTLMRLLYFP